MFKLEPNPTFFAPVEIYVPGQGKGTIDGDKIELQGSWKSGSQQYEAKYSGSFVRRGAKLKGTQTWTDGGKPVTRACAGAIKRPLKPFMPRAKKQAAG